MAIYGQMVVPSKAGGGSLPTNGETPTPYVPGVGVNGRFSDAGVQIAGQAAQQAAQGMGNLGKGLQKLGGFGMIMASRENRLDLARADEAFAALQNEAIAKQTEWEKLKGLPGVDVLEMKAKWWDDAHARHMEGLGDAGKRYYNLQSDRLGVTLDQWASRYGEQQRTAYEKQAIAFGMDSEANAMALDATNFDAVDRSLAHIRVMCDRSAMNQGLDAATAGQMYQAAASKAVGNTLGILLSQGKKIEAEAFMTRYGNLLSAADYAKANETYNTMLTQLASGSVKSGDVAGLRALVAGSGAQNLNSMIEVAAGATVGQKYTWGANDCSGHTAQIWQAVLPDGPLKWRIFGRDGEHKTAAEMMKDAAAVAGLREGAQVNVNSVKGGWLLATTGQGHAKGRWRDTGHVVTTFEKPDGSVWVSEAGSSSGKVNTISLQEFLGRYHRNGRNVLGVDLSGLAGQARGMQAAPAGGGRVGGRLAQVPTYTGVARIMAYHESGKEGSMHVSYGLPEKDGVDVGKYSFITGNAGGGPGGSVARFIKWMGTNGGDLGRQLYSGFNQLVGGNWAALNNADLWKSKGAALWKSIVQQNPAEFERLEDTFALKGINAKIKTLSPDLQQAIENDQTGALREMAISTINQYGSGAEILQRQWNDHKHEGLESFVKNVYIDKSNPKYFAAFKDKNIGARRAKREVEDVLGLLRGGIPSQQGHAAQSGMPMQAMGRSFTVLPQTRQAMDANMIPTQANALYMQAVAGGGTPEEQEERFMRSLDGLDQAMKDKVRPLGERWFADMKQDRDRQGQIQYQEAWELLSKGKNRRDQENLYLQLMQSPKLNDVARAKLKARWNEEQQVEKPEGQKWTAEMYGKIDEYWKDNAQASADIDKAIDTAAGSGAITDKQAQDLHEWNRSGGARKALVGDTGYLKQAYNQLLDPKVKKEKWKDVPPELLQRLWQRVKSNGSKAVTQDEIKAMLAEEMSVSYVQAPSFVSRILPAAGLVFPGMMTSTKETRYWQAQTSGEKLVGIVPLPREYAKIAKEAAEHGYDPGDPEAVARYNLIRLTSQRSK